MRWPTWSWRSSRGERPAPRPIALATLVIVLLVLASCGAAAHTATRASIAAPAAAVGQTTMAASAALRSAAAAAPALGAPVAGAQASNAQSPNGQTTTLPSLPAGQMLIRTATIDLEATNPAALVDQVRQIAATAADGAEAGYVADERLQSDGTAFTATITIDVPAPTFANVMDQLRRLGTKVVNETSSSQDVTEQYVDVDAQLQALRATQAQLIRLLGKTQQVSETLDVQRELSSVNVQINQLEGRENYLKSHSAYSTIVVTIQPPATGVVVKPLSWDPLSVLTGALATLGVAAQRAVDVLIWVLVFGLPLAVLVGLGIGVQRLVVRRVRARV